MYYDVNNLYAGNKYVGKREDKLLTTLYDTQRYVILPQSAAMYSSRSLRNKNSSDSLNLHGSVITFQTRAKNDFEENLYKLVNNAVFGKTMRNRRNKINNKMGRTI